MYERTEGEDAVGFHVSLAWALKEPSKEVKEALEKALKEKVEGGLRVQEEMLRMKAEVVKVKIGSDFYEVPLLGAADHGGEGKKRRLSTSV